MYVAGSYEFAFFFKKILYVIIYVNMHGDMVIVKG